MVLKKIVKNILIKDEVKGSNEPTDNFFLDKIAVLLFGVSLLPFIVLAFYNNPQFDDFTFFAWSNSMSFTEYMHFVLLNENGRFTALSLLYFIPDPGVSLIYFKIYPVFILVFFAFTLSFFIKIFFKTSKTTRWLIVVGLISCYLNSMPSLSEGIYWVTGGIAHFTPLILILWVFIYLKQINTQSISNSQKNVIKAFLLFLSFFIVGFEEIILVYVVFVFFFLTIIAFILKLEHKRYYLLIFTISVLGALIVIFSPGSISRANNSHSEKAFDIIHTLYGAMYWGSFHFFNTVIKSPLFFFILFLLFKPDDTIQLNFKKSPILHPLLLLLLSYLLIILLFFPGILSMVGTYTRMINVILFLSITIVIVNLFNLKLYYRKLSFYRLPDSLKYFPIILSLFLLFIGNHKTAINDILYGTAKNYDLEVTQRLKILNNEKNKELVTIKKFKSYPKSICIADISNKHNDWESACYSVYYNIKKLLFTNQ